VPSEVLRNTILESPRRADPYNAYRRPYRALGRRPRVVFLIGHRVTFGFLNHNGLSYAAAMAFWLLLSLPPLIIAISSVATQLIDADNARQILAQQVVAQLPAEGDLIRALVEHEIELASLGGVASLVFLLFSGSRVFTALITAIYVMWRHVEQAGLIRREGMRLLLAAIVGGLLVGSLVAQIAVLSLQEELGALTGILVGWVLPFLLVVSGLFITYRLLPRGRATWKTALLGALLAAAGLRIAQLVFVLLLGTVLEFDEGYGPLAEVALLATWAFFASAIVLLGAELVATLDRHKLPHIPLPSSKRGDPDTDGHQPGRDADRGEEAYEEEHPDRGDDGKS
jgi:membrane protein